MEIATLMDPAAWVQQTFSQVHLGDTRREKRLLKLAQDLVTAPEKSLPKQLHKRWGPLKAAYRFLQSDAVSFEVLSRPHWQQTQTEAKQQDGVVLMVQDTTELDYGYASATQGLGPVGNGTHVGFFLQTVLAIRAADRAVLGIAAQETWVREPAPRDAKGQKESSQQRKKRSRESGVWQRCVQAVGAPTGPARLVHVADSGADAYAFFAQCRETGNDFLVRACQPRRVSPSPGRAGTLLDRIRELPSRGTRVIEVKSEHERKARMAKMCLSVEPMEIQETSETTHRAKSETGMPVWVVRAWEVEAPLKEVGQRARTVPVKHRRKSHAVDEEHVEPLEWVLITSVPVHTEQEAWERVAWYGMRWLAEEYHHGLKTGCGIEKRHLGTQQGQERLLGLLAPMALRLLQLRELMTRCPQEPAHGWFSGDELLVISRKAGHDAQEWTVEQVLREIASWGGFLGRKSDGRPGWKSLWAGWERLTLMVQGVQIARLNAQH